MAIEKERSISDVVQDIFRNIQEMLRSEVRLAKTELREEAVKAKATGVLIGAGAVSAIFALFFLLLMTVYALTRVVPDWAAALIVAGFMATVAGLMLNAGMKRLRQLHPTPERTIENIKENVEWVKQKTK
ncbi:MAG: phage holin family protein [Candidatus Solibacter sp.]